MKVLVTAVGGDLGQAIVKALALSGPSLSVAGCDVDPGGVGPAFVREYDSVPAAAHASYLAQIDALCARRGVAALIPASEAEIHVLSRIGPLPSGAAVVSQPAAWIATFADKLACFRTLAPHVALAPFADGDDRAGVTSLVRGCGFPVVVKPRISSGSRRITVAHTAAELDAALEEVPIAVVQAYLDDTKGEFSVGVFRAPGVETAIAFKRDLGRVGCTWYAETVNDAEVLAYALAIARASDLRGSANVQVRKTAGGVRLLEINARFSSLVAARAACGFRDVEWSLALALKQPLPPVPATYGHVRFRRFFHEMLDYGSGYTALGAWAPATEQHKPTVDA